MSEMFDPAISYRLHNGLPDDPSDCEHDEEKIEEGSDVFFEALSPLINVQTGRFDPTCVPEYIARYQEAIEQLPGFSYAEIDYALQYGTRIIEDGVQFQRGIAAKEQYGC